MPLLFYFICLNEVNMESGSVTSMPCTKCNGLGWVKLPFDFNPSNHSSDETISEDLIKWFNRFNNVCHKTSISKDVSNERLSIGCYPDTCSNIEDGSTHVYENFFTSYHDSVSTDDDILDGDCSDASFAFSSSLEYPYVIDSPLASVIDFVACDPLPEQSYPDCVLEELDAEPEPMYANVIKNVPKKQPKKTSHKRSVIKPKQVVVSSTETSLLSKLEGVGLVESEKSIASDVEEDIQWYPGFNRQLGAKGRCAILDLVRRVYRQNPDYYKAILNSRNPPSSISSLPFFNIPSLWELTFQFGIFQQALALTRIHAPAQVKSKKKEANDVSISEYSTTANTESSSIIHFTKRKKRGTIPNYSPGSSPLDLKTASGRSVKKSSKYFNYPDVSTKTPTRTRKEALETLVNSLQQSCYKSDDASVSQTRSNDHLVWSISNSNSSNLAFNDTNRMETSQTTSHKISNGSISV